MFGYVGHETGECSFCTTETTVLGFAVSKRDVKWACESCLEEFLAAALFHDSIDRFITMTRAVEQAGRKVDWTKVVAEGSNMILRELQSMIDIEGVVEEGEDDLDWWDDEE